MKIKVDTVQFNAYCIKEENIKYFKEKLDEFKVY